MAQAPGTPGTTVPTAPPPTGQSPQTGKASAALVKYVAGWVSDLGLEAEIAAVFSNHAERIAVSRPWLGDQGMLFEVRIAQSISDPNLPRHYRVIEILDHGISNSQGTALAASMGKTDQEFHPEVPDGFLQSDKHSFFLWTKAEGEPVKVAWPSNKIVVRDALIIHSNEILRSQLREQHVADRWRALEVAAVTSIPEANGRAAFERSVRAVKAAFEEMREINKRLADAQEAARRSAAALQWLSTVGTIFSLAAQIAEISNRLGNDAPPSPMAVNTSGDLVNYVHTVNVRRQDGVTTYEQQKTIIINDYQGKLQELKIESKQWNVPEEVLPRLP